jgi:hypothetical protein
MEFVLTAAIATTKAAFDALSLAIKVRDEAKISAATHEMQERLRAMSDIAMSYVEKNAALVSKNATLELASAENARAHADLVERLRERERYALHEVRPGAFVYTYKPGVDGEQKPAHYLCQNCYDKGIKSVLRHQPAKRSIDARLDCSENPKHAIGMGGALPSEPPVQRGSYFG